MTIFSNPNKIPASDIVDLTLPEGGIILKVETYDKNSRPKTLLIKDQVEHKCKKPGTFIYSVIDKETSEKIGIVGFQLIGSGEEQGVKRYFTEGFSSLNKKPSSVMKPDSLETALNHAVFDLAKINNIHVISTSKSIRNRQIDSIVRDYWGSFEKLSIP